MIFSLTGGIERVTFGMLEKAPAAAGFDLGRDFAASGAFRA